MSYPTNAIAPATIAINDLPELDGEAALFDARIDPADLPCGDDHVIISVIIYS
jgi:hypothetical protein